MKFIPNRGALVEINAPGGIVHQAVARAAGKARDDAKRIIYAEGRVQTGALGQSVRAEQSRYNGQSVRYFVRSDLKYSLAQHEGVKGPVYPKRAKALRFQQNGKVIFAKSTKGFKGIKYLTRAVDNLTPADFA